MATRRPRQALKVDTPRILARAERPSLARSSRSRQLLTEAAWPVSGFQVAQTTTETSQSSIRNTFAHQVEGRGHLGTSAADPITASRPVPQPDPNGSGNVAGEVPNRLEEDKIGP